MKIVISELLDRIDMFARSDEMLLNLVYCDSDPNADNVEMAVKNHVFKRGYYKTYNVWTDGCNYADEAHIIFQKITNPPLKRPHRCCGWASEIWKFDSLLDQLQNLEISKN